MNKIFIILLCMLGVFTSCFSDEVTARLDRKKVSMNESFSLVFTGAKKNYDKPDFSKLQEDFDILSSGVQVQTSIINGKFSEETNWTLHLMAKRAGNLTIPSIQFGQDNSLPVSIEVEIEGASKQDDAIFIDTELTPSSVVYEQTPLIYTIRLYTSMQLAQGTLSEIKTNDPDAIYEKINQDVQYETFYKNGKRYTVVERKYTIIPQHVGKLIVEPTVFEGTILSKNYSVFDQQTTFKRIRSTEKQIEVKETPPAFKNQQGILANDFVVTEKWSTDTSKLILGDPVTWEITLKADGALANQIADPIFNFPKDLKFYLDKPEFSNTIVEGEISSVKQMKVAIIPSKAGDYTLPELQLKWWNLKTNKEEIVILPKRVLQVVGDEVAIADTTVTTIDHSDLIADGTDEFYESDETSEPASKMYDSRALIAIGIFLIISTPLFLFYLITKQRQKKIDSIRQLKQKLKRACLDGNTKCTEYYLLAWMAQVFPHIKPLNMMTIKRSVPTDLQESIDDLYKALYSHEKEWNGSALWNACSTFHPKKKANKEAANNNEELKVKHLYPK